jgi:hypothetical protein
MFLLSHGIIELKEKGYPVLKDEISHYVRNDKGPTLPPTFRGAILS